MTDPATLVWTDERLEQLKKLWAEGLSITQIGLELGLSRNAVVGKVHRIGLPKRGSPIVRSDKPFEPKRRKMSPLAATAWDRNACSWPLGDPKSAEFKFCGDKVVPGKPYSGTRCAQAYTSMKERNAA